MRAPSSVLILTMGSSIQCISLVPEALLLYNTIFLGLSIPIIQMRHLWDNLIFIMEPPVLVIWHIHIEMASKSWFLWVHITICQHWFRWGLGPEQAICNEIHVRVQKLDPNWFQKWLIMYLVPCHFLNQHWHIDNWSLRNKLQWNLDQNTKLSFKKIHLKMCAKCLLSCLVLILLKYTRVVAVTDFIQLPMSVWAINGGQLTLHTYGRLGSEDRITLDGTLQKGFHQNWTEYNLCYITQISLRADSKFVPSQWEMALHCNGISHWLGSSLESVLSSIFYKTVLTLQQWNMNNGKIDQDQGHDHSTKLTNCGLVIPHEDKCSSQHLLR